MAIQRHDYGLIFDLDGTLVDSYEAIAAALNHAREAHGKPALQTEVVRRAVGHGLEQLIERWVGAEHIESGVALFRERYAEVFRARTHPLPGVASGLKRLNEGGYRMAVASNKPARFSRAILDQLGWSRWFLAIEGPDTVGSTKPDPAMLRACIAALETSPDRTRYVGDMLLDVSSAQRAGLEVVLLAGGSSSMAELQSTGHPVLSGFDRLLPFIAQLGWPPAVDEDAPTRP